MSETGNESVHAEMERHYQVKRFLNHEAQVLDERSLHEWLDILTDDIEYKMPVRQTRDRGVGLEREFSDESFHLVEDRGSLEARVKRFESEFAWSVDPPLRARRFVTNIRVCEPTDDELPVRSNFLFYRSQGDTPDSDTLVGERRDQLRRTEDGLKLADRRVLLDHTILPTKNLPFFL